MKKLFVMLISFAQILAFFTSCSNDITSGTAPVISKTVDLAPIIDVSIESPISLTVVQGPVQEVVIEGYENLVNMVELRVDNGVLKAFLNGSTNGDFNLEVQVVIPTVDQLIINGPGSISLEAFDDLDNLLVEINNAGSVKLRGDVTVLNTLDARITSGGSGSIILAGTARDLNIDMKGAGSLNAFNLTAEECIANLRGAGSAKVKVTDALDATLSGVGDLMYKGNPQITQKVSGIGNVIDAN